MCGKCENLQKHLVLYAYYITHKVCGCRQVFWGNFDKNGQFLHAKIQFYKLTVYFFKQPLKKFFPIILLHQAVIEPKNKTSVLIIHITKGHPLKEL